MNQQYLITWKSHPDSTHIMACVRQGTCTEVTEQAIAEIRDACPFGVLVDVIEYSEWYARAQA